MASPQLENGYTRLCNELFEAGYKKITNSTWLRIFFHTIRLTYGFQKKDVLTNYKAYMTKLNLTEETVRNSILDMTDKNILVSKFIDNRTFVTGINKNYDNWKL